MHNPPHDTPPDPAPHELVLLKDGQRFVFRCAVGRERELLAHLRTLAADPEVELDAFDAAVLSQQVVRRLSDRLTRHAQAPP
ncbi:MAG: hypothetical protein WD009_11290 [Phycisphaeraceae bacterium]